MNFADMQNAVLQRLHQAGIVWGGSPTNAAGNLVPPYWLQLELNLAYARVFTKVKDYPTIVNPIICQWPTMAGQDHWSMNPLPSQGPAQASIPGPNPVAMHIYEIKYTQSGGQTRYIPFTSTRKFRYATGGYLQRLGAFAAYPYILTQFFGRKQIDMWQGTAVNGDTITATICPDPVATGRLVPQIPCSQGGPMVNATDVPLLADESYHGALVEGAVYSIARALNKPQIAQEALAMFNDMIQDMIDYGSTANEGTAEQEVNDPWITAYNPDISPYGEY